MSKQSDVLACTPHNVYQCTMSKESGLMCRPYSRVRPQHHNIVAVLTQKHGALAATAVGMRKNELDGISTKLGGMLVFLNEGEVGPGKYCLPRHQMPEGSE